MYIRVDAVTKKCTYDVEKKKTKITMFDTGIGDDIDMKFPEDIVFKPGTPIRIEGDFTVSHFQSGSYLTGVPGQYSIDEVGRIVYDKKQPAEKAA